MTDAAAGRIDGAEGEARPMLELERFLPYRLNVLAHVVSQGLSELYAGRHGLGIPEWRVIATLGQFGTMTAKQIGTHSHMHKTKVSRAVASLMRRRLVSRRANRQDLREAFLALTGPGRAVYGDLVPLAQDFAATLVAGLSQEDQAALDRLITGLTAAGRGLVRESPAGPDRA